MTDKNDDQNIDLSDIPELGDEFFANAKLRLPRRMLEAKVKELETETYKLTYKIMWLCRCLRAMGMSAEVLAENIRLAEEKADSIYAEDNNEPTG